MPETITIDRDDIITAYQENSTNTNRQYRVRVYEDGHTDIANPNDFEVSSEIERIPPRRFIATDQTDPHDIDLDNKDAMASWSEAIELAHEITLARGYEVETTVPVQTANTSQKKQNMTDSRNSTSNVSLFTSSETDEWATPPDFLRPLKEAVGGFDLDAAAGAEDSPIAESAYSEDDDGLAQPWFGTVWVNPPYSAMEEWTKKVISELHRDDVEAILYLCKGDTSTNWWHTALAEATAIGMLDSRLSFGDSSRSAPFASHVFVFGDADDAVLDTLDQWGAVFTADHVHEKTVQAKLVSNK